MRDEFPYHVFLSHRAKDKAMVRPVTRSASNGERAKARYRIASKQEALFPYFKPEAQEILADLLVKYATNGELQWVAVRQHLPDVQNLPPISQRGNVNEIIGKFGGADQLRNGVNQLPTLLYAA